MALSTLFSLLGYAFGLRALGVRNTALALLTALSGLVCATYLGGCLGLLRPTAALLYWGGLASLGLCLVLAALRRVSPRGLVDGPEIPILLALSVLHLYLFREANLFYWDEFSHWALAVKEMFWRGELYGVNSNMSHAHYPPGASLWLYFVASNSRFSEPVLYFAQFTLVLVPTFAFYKNLSFRQPHWIAAALCAQIFLLATLGHGVVNLLVDHALAAWFGGVLVLYLSDRYSPRELLLFIPCLAVLALIKDLGLFLACAAGLFIAAHRLWFSGEPGPFWKRRRLLGVGLLLLLAGPLASWSWSVWRQEAGAAPSLSMAQVGKALALAGSGPQEEKSLGERAREKAHRATVLSRFTEALLKQPLGRTELAYDFNEYNYGMLALSKDSHRLSAVGWVCLFLALSAAAWAFTQGRPERRRTIVLSTGFLLVLSLLYGGMLLYLYAAVFDWGKGEALASYDRYCNILIMPLVFVALAWHFPLWTDSEPPARSGAARYLVFPLLLALYCFEPPYFRSLYWQPANNFFRKDIAPLAESLRAVLGKDDRLYVVFPVEESGLFRLMTIYDFSPIRTTISPPNILEKEPEALHALLRNSTHALFLLREHPGLAWFKSITTDGLRSNLYRVAPEEQGVRLEPLL